MPFILDDIFLLPARLSWDIVKGIRDKVDEELYPDEKQIKKKLIELQTLLDEGKISEKKYEKQEEKLMARWRFLQEYREAESKEREKNGKKR